MNIATLTELDGAPALIIYAENKGGHQHRDTIDGVTLDGQSLSRRFPDEEMPTHQDVQPWLIHKVQEMLGTSITFRAWHQGRSIHIMSVDQSPDKRAASAAV